MCHEEVVQSMCVTGHVGAMCSSVLYNSPLCFVQPALDFKFIVVALSSVWNYVFNIERVITYILYNSVG